MSFKDFQNETRRQELNQERKATLNGMTALVQEASRANIQSLLKLPDAIRIKWIDEVGNYRVMLKERLTRYLSGGDTDKEVEDLRIMQGIIDGIDEVDRITAEMISLGDGNESDPPEEPDPDPDAGSSPGAEPAVNAA